MRTYKRPGTNYYWYDFTINGVRYRDSTRRTNKAEADKVMNTEYRKVLDKQQFGTKPEITLADAFDRVIKSVEGSTRVSYDLCKRKWLGLGAFGQEVDGRGPLWHLEPTMKLHELTDEHLEEHTDFRREEGLRPNSINVEKRVLKAVVNAHKRRFRVNEDLEFKLVKGFVKTRFLTEGELSEIEMKLNEAEGVAYKKALDLLIFLRDTGARLSEGLNCRWRDFNLTKGTFEIYRIKTDSLSYVPLTPRVIAMLKVKQEVKAKRPFEEMSRAIRLLRKAIDEVANEDPRLVAQRGKATIHTLRDTYGSYLVQNGMSLHELSKMLGHTSQAMSAKYGHLEGKDVAEKARRLMNARG